MWHERIVSPRDFLYDVFYFVYARSVIDGLTKMIFNIVDGMQYNFTDFMVLNYYTYSLI